MLTLDEIVADTERVCGNNRGISEKTIILKIYSPNVLPLTLVDTPGLARVCINIVFNSRLLLVINQRTLNFRLEKWLIDMCHNQIVLYLLFKQLIKVLK